MNFKVEIWRDVKDFEGFYQVSNFGRIKSLDRIIQQHHRNQRNVEHIYKGKILKGNINKNGYITVDLHKKGKIKTFLLHRLIAETFIPKVKGKNIINHKDNNPTNNQVNNLEWCTQSENIKYAYEFGNKKPPHQKRIIQFDRNNNFICEWESQTQIERVLGIKQANISKVCLGKRSQAGGYLWEFIK